MRRTITAWAVVDPTTGRTLYLRFNEEFARGLADGASHSHLTVVELTGELPDPPKTVTIGNTWWKKRDDGRWQIYDDPDRIQSVPQVFLDRIWELEQQIGGAARQRRGRRRDGADRTQGARIMRRWYVIQNAPMIQAETPHEAVQKLALKGHLHVPHMHVGTVAVVAVDDTHQFTVEAPPGAARRTRGSAARSFGSGSARRSVSSLTSPMRIEERRRS
jgi:hypothetical protein